MLGRPGALLLLWMHLDAHATPWDEDTGHILAVQLQDREAESPRFAHDLGFPGSFAAILAHFR